MSTYSGTLIAELIAITVSKTQDYSIEEIVDIITAEAEPLPPCAICERPAAVKVCKSCNLRFCVNGCFKAHDCCQVDGPNNSDPLRG